VQSVLFHGGIGVVTGLVIFALEATMLQLVLFPDSSYRALASRPRRFGRNRAPAVYNSERLGEISESPGTETATEA
jgi:hypothetical protein